jgi:two-component system, chemotaxis family, protein-glutamate methylesterase/glutaminase
MEKKRILVVDDSAIVRKMVSLAMEGDPDLEPVVAPNGHLGLAKIERSRPELVVLDVEMPDMNGLETLALIRAQYPKLPVIIFSAQTERGSAIGLEALARGATDCVPKPSTHGIEESLDYVREHLITKVRGLCHLPERPTKSWIPVPNKTNPNSASAPASASASPILVSVPRPPITPPSKVVPARPTGQIELLVIGVSTGGPNALADLVPSFNKDIGVPVLIVQHMPPMFTKLLADRMASLCPLHCKEAVSGEEIGPGDLRLAPGNFHMTVSRKEKSEPRHFVTYLNQEPPENSCRPAVDVLFRHAAACAQNRVLAVVLTGMGQDGLRGCEAVRSEGGAVLAQDEATSVVWGMPGAVSQAGLADAVLPLNEIGPEIMRRLRGGKR